MKKLVLLASLFFLMLTGLFAQDNSPVGEWAKYKIGNSDYFLEIDNDTIKYVDKKTEAYITWKYYIRGEYIYFGKVIAQTDETLCPELSKNNNDNKIRFSRNGDLMKLYLTDEGVTFITKEAKEKQLAEAKSIGLGLLGLVAGAALKEATDTVATESEVKVLADKVYRAAW